MNWARAGENRIAQPCDDVKLYVHPVGRKGEWELEVEIHADTFVFSCLEGTDGEYMTEEEAKAAAEDICKAFLNRWQPK